MEVQSEMVNSPSLMTIDGNISEYEIMSRTGLKTGMYYLRTRSAMDAIKFTVDQALLKLPAQPPSFAQPGPTPTTEEDGPVCRKEGCSVCGS